MYKIETGGGLILRIKTMISWKAQKAFPSFFYHLFCSSGADAINISGLLVKESRLLNPKKLGNFDNQML